MDMEWRTKKRLTDFLTKSSAGWGESLGPRLISFRARNLGDRRSFSLTNSQAGEADVGESEAEKRERLRRADHANDWMVGCLALPSNLDFTLQSHT